MKRKVEQWIFGSAAMLLAVKAIARIARADVVFNEQIPFDVIVPNGCAPFNPLEAVGNVHIVFRFTDSASGTQHGDGWSNLDSYEATDTVTGTVYHARENGQTQGIGKFSFNEPAGAAFEGTRMTQIRVEDQNSLPNSNFDMHEHLSVPAGGAVDADVSDFRFTCQ